MSIRLWAPLAVATLVFGTSPILAASNVRSAAGNTPSVAALPAPRNDVDIGIRRLSWQAPVGHRQPKRVEVPRNTQLTLFEAEQRRLDAELDKKLVICRGC
jgi:hypothetical protein